VLEQAPGMEKVFYTLEQKRMQPVFALYPWSPDLSTAVPPGDVTQFEQALFARTACTEGKRSPQTPKLHTLNASSHPEKVQQVTQDRMTALEWLKRAWITFGVGILVMGYVGVWFVYPSETVLRVHGVLLAVVVGTGVLVVLLLPFWARSGS